MALQKAMVSSKSNEWDTPVSFFKLLDDEFNFTLDPCCREDTAKCKKFYTIVNDGLKQDWSKDVVFMNPPYGGHTGDWIKKALEESRKGATVVCLIVSSTDRSYWHEYIFPFASQVRFVRGRIKFGNSKSTAPFASAVVIFSQKEYSQKIVYYSRSINKATYDFMTSKTFKRVDSDWLWVAERILAEYKKHGKTLPDEWHKIAAAKITGHLQTLQKKEETQ